MDPREKNERGTMEVILAVVCLGIMTIALLVAGLHFKIPSIVSFLIIGILAGPYALSIVTDQTTIETIGEIGVILLLFTIGLEFSFKTLLESWRVVIIGGCLQVVTTIIAASTVMYFLRGLQFSEAVFFGFLVSLSSTAIVMKVLQERGNVETVPGRTLLGILIFQDLAIIPMILLTPFLIGSGGISYDSIPAQIAKVIGIFVILIVSARWVVPWFLYRVAKQRSRELFVFSVAAICFAVAWLTNSAGLSYSLGAFVAGLIIGESEFSIDAVSTIIPFRDVFAAIFFLSIGMLLDPSVIFSRTEIVITLLAVIFVVKTVTGSLTAAFLGMPVRVAIFVGLALAQIGEFSFVLAKSGLGSNLLGDGPYQVFLVSAIITMAATPFTMNAAPLITSLFYRIFPSRHPSARKDDEMLAKPEPLRDHIIIAGYGVNGRSVARAADIAGIPYIAIDMDPEVTRREQARGMTKSIIFGDASHEEILEHAGIRHARSIVIVISEENVVPRIVHLARNLAPEIHIIVRTRYISNVQYLLEMGADEVIPEESETSARLFSRVLGRYVLSENETNELVEKLAKNRRRFFTRQSADPNSPGPEFEEPFGSLSIHTLPVTAGAAVMGKTLQEVNLGNSCNVRVLAVRRGTNTTIRQDTEIHAGDSLVVDASEQNLRSFLAQVTGR
ncbi:MAG: cation:proton antiporter [Methanoregula sp.]|nr:cation:proton antiporter [Methanoregula sp.]